MVRSAKRVSNHEATDGPASFEMPLERLLRMRVLDGAEPAMTLTLPSTFVIDSPGDAARAAELRRVKLLATLVLAVTFAVFIGARWLLPVHPAFGFVAAFAEAATIGGLARRFAGVAPFQRALGLSGSRTATIPRTHER